MLGIAIESRTLSIIEALSTPAYGVGMSRLNYDSYDPVLYAFCLRFLGFFNALFTILCTPGVRRQ